LNALRSFAHRSHLGAAASCVSTLVRSAPRPAPCRRVALQLHVRHSARCVGPTSAFSRSSYQYPRLVGSRCVLRFHAGAIEEIACLTSVRFASVGHVCRGVTAVGVVFPSRCVRSVPLASLSPPSRESCRSRDLRTRESRRDRSQPDRVNDASWTSNPRCLPSSKNLCPATPFRAPGSGLPRRRGLATATPDLDTVSLPQTLADLRESDPRPRAPLPTGDTILWV